MTTNTVAASVGDEVRAMMARRRISQTKLALAMGKSQSSVNRRLRGKQPFDVEELAQVAQILDVPLSTFLPDPVSAA